MPSAKFEDRSVPGGVVYNPASPYAREMAKWEMAYSPYGPPGRPRELHGNDQWPAMFYKMKRSETNGDFITEHYISVNNEQEAKNMESRGYRQGQVAAIELVKQQEQEVARAAAERAYRDKGMSEKAKLEAAAADDATSKHLAEVPVTPLKPRGRPKKVTAAV